MPQPLTAPCPFRFIAAPFTPFHENGRLKLDVIQPYADKLHRDGVAGVFVCGTTGEGPSLSTEERCEVAAAWKEALQGRMQLIVHVGHLVLEEATALAQHAAEIDADAIAAIGPLFFSPSSVEALCELNRRIAAAAHELPFYYYHMPAMSRVTDKASVYQRAMQQHIPSFAGIKFTHNDIVDYQLCLDQSRPHEEVFFGRDELLLSGLQQGARAAVGSTYNFATPLYRKVAEAHAAGDGAEAERLQALCTSAIECIVQHGGLSGIKETLAQAGIDCGPPRLPLQAPCPTAKQAIATGLKNLGYFEAIANVVPMPAPGTIADRAHL